MIKISLIVPVFKRADEVIELVDSLAAQPYPAFELILVDGSPTNELESVDQYVREHHPQLPFQRIYVKGLGISASRNLGASKARGEYCIFMDSDVLVPAQYFATLEQTFATNNPDAFGGPDAAHISFSRVQKAISFSMTSLLTTGGIRGKKAHVGTFKPRGFNMGIRKSVFDQLGGFDTTLPVGEDMDLSARIIAGGYKTMLIPEAFVYHKRRVSVRKFYRQVFRFGAARVMLSQMHAGEMKLTHLFPLFFSLYLIGGLAALCCPVYPLLLWPLSLILYFLLIFISATITNQSLSVGFTAILTTIVQFLAYAHGFLKNGAAVWLLKKPSGIFERKEGEPESPL